VRAHYGETAGDRTDTAGASGTATLELLPGAMAPRTETGGHTPKRTSVVLPRASSDAERGWLVGGLAVVVGLTLADLALGNKMTLGGALVLTPFFASVGARPRPVCLVGGVALMAGTGLAVLDGIGLRETVTRVSVLAIGTGVACEAARLRVRRERRLIDLTSIAEAAQRAIIREPEPVVGSVALASCYESSADAAAVGGDCYEALDTPYGTRLMIGDVRGHGLRSVGLAAFTLGAFRALAYIEPDLVNIARELDQLVARYAAGAESRDVDGEEFVTVVLAQVSAGTLLLANCGHPAPLLVGPGGQVSLLEVGQPVVPLGLGGCPNLQSIDLPPGARVLLYTDGLVESRDRRGCGFDLLSAAAHLASVPLEEGARALIAQLKAHTQGRIADDVALLVFELLPRPDRPPSRLRTGAMRI
jgi:sigma-B regulation protein RsbU (phosphoserine phosphatase)